jgi:uncharacterized membrane protein YgdD (TMEM256/DUF423 family)
MNLRVSACLVMAVAVACGAFGAHGLKSILSQQMLDVWKTAVLYQAVHGLALLAIALSPFCEAVRKPSVLMIAGITVFSGSLYLLALTSLKWLGMITPIGGSAMIAAWLWLAFILRDQKS